ncbi:uncharacterized protein LOC112571715 isoform X1 [Pomacea canaliculata]|uniref:uncharacterized protein LOC112571715 isoform X1 n=1 Tax=Pomacea canaliculata TaxID=400727 RepID=UPI000D732BCA|nr:uncharacterized protein LOC112571715 isoform X1 [Pomacea canaliculata]XP_025106723.1 uncharacterized protein LOC112571715 isoform X1 [Pomacea canaliculata]
MSGRDRIPRINSVQDLSMISDLDTALDVMDQLEINMDGVNDLDDALSRIRGNFNKSQVIEMYIKQDRDMKEVVNADRSNREQMIKMFNEASNYLNKLPPHFRQDLEHMFPTYLEWVKKIESELQKSDCTILFAGETGAGKSTLINLVVGCQILPTDIINGTKTICELRHSETERKAIFHYCDGRKSSMLVCRTEQEVSRFLAELTNHVTMVDQQTDESPYEKIEIYWPLPILGSGVVMVDSPGVGDSRKLSKQLESYMSRAFGFIYVINSSNAGGIHRDRLGQLLRQAVERSEFGFDPSTALFVCNWWDQVPPAEQEKVLGVTLGRLSQVWPGVRRSQVFPISSIRALKAVESRHILPEYKELVAGIRLMLPRTLNSKLCTYYRWLSGVLKRSLYSLKISINIGRKQMADKETMSQNVRSQMEALDRQSEDSLHDMRDNLRREVDATTRKLVAFLKSEDCMAQLRYWTPTDCPPPDTRNVKNVVKEAASKFAERLTLLVDDWEYNNNQVSRIKSSIIKSFQRRLELFEDQLKKIESVLFDGVEGTAVITDFHSSMRHQMPVKNVWQKARKEKVSKPGESGFLSLGNAISGCRTLDLKAKQLQSIFKHYSSRDPRVMAEACMYFLQTIKEEDLAYAIKKFFERVAKRFDAASKLLPEFLKADRSLLQTLQGEVKDEQQMLRDVYPNLVSSCLALQGQLDMFFVRRLMLFDFHMSELRYDASKPIGRGTFADVYTSSIATQEGNLTVALKIQREKLTSKNVSDVLLEDRTLRDLKHKHIIHYYGAAKEQHGADLRWVMVLEACKRTIKQRFMNDSDARVPGRVEIASLRVDAMREVAHFALQICSALSYLHDRNIVHRDLKSDNILLTDKDVVKLTDVGLAKQARDIAGTLAGTPVYMAPEILLQQGQYDMRADIYSLAVILWELWYGEDSADHISTHLFGRLEDAIKNGLRPSVTMSQKPPDDWIKLLQSGWEYEAARRPSVKEVAEFFERFLRDNPS